MCSMKGKVPFLAISLKHHLYYLEEIHPCYNKWYPGLGIDLLSLRFLWATGMMNDIFCCL